MNAVLPVWGDYSGLEPSLNCAIANAGCPVHLVAEAPHGNCHFHPISEFPFPQRVLERLMDALSPSGRRLHACSIARWFVVRQMITTKLINLPIYVFDWDVLIFGDLSKAHIPFAQYDFAVSMESKKPLSPITAPSYVNRVEPLNSFCSLVESLLNCNAPRLKSDRVNDMVFWAEMALTFGWHYGDTSDVYNNSTFDHHLMAQTDRYLLGDIGKRIEWVGGTPHFVHKDGRLIKANTLHCWGPFKNTESWLVKRSKMS